MEFRCDVCAGGGQIISGRSGKLVKCRSCGGDGLKRCPCRDGFLQCSGCAGKGVAKVWLTVEQEQRAENCVAGDLQFRRADLSDASPNNVKTTQVWSGTPTAAPPPIQEVLGECPLTPATLSSHDRVTDIRVETRSTQTAVVSYELAGEVGRVTIPGWSGELARCVRLATAMDSEASTPTNLGLGVPWVLRIVGVARQQTPLLRSVASHCQFGRPRHPSSSGAVAGGRAAGQALGSRCRTLTSSPTVLASGRRTMRSIKSAKAPYWRRETTCKPS